MTTILPEAFNAAALSQAYKLNMKTLHVLLFIDSVFWITVDWTGDMASWVGRLGW